MKISIGFFWVFIMASGLVGCSANSNYKLKITLDSTFNYRLMDSITLISDDFYLTVEPYNEKSWTYDSINKSTTFYWDSLGPGKYTFKFQTIFSKYQALEFSLKSDSAFFLRNNLSLAEADLINKNELSESDTIEIHYTTKGCFHDLYEHFVLVRNKKDDNYILHSTSTNNNEAAPANAVQPIVLINPGIIDTMVQVQVESNAQEDYVRSENLHMVSTTTQALYILAKDKLFMFSDRGHGEWNLYEKIKKNLKPKS